MYIAGENRYDQMKYIRAGKTGLKLPAISLGFWHNFGKHDNMDNMRAIVHTAFDHGITHFDLANNYGPDPGCAEEHFGYMMEQDLRPYREELLISTKAGCEMWNGPYGQLGSRKHLLSSLDQSLKRMKLDYVDIFYLHCMDPETPVEESMLALDQAVKSGKALYVGISNHDAERAAKATEILTELKTPFVLHQNSFSILNRKIEKNGLKEFARDHGQGIIAFKPLEQGMLTDKYLNGIPEDSRIRRDGRFLRESSLSSEKMAKIRELNEIARQRGQSLAQMALAWVLQDPAVSSVLIGASRPEQILDNLGMLKNCEFTDGELAEIDAIANRTEV